MTILAERRSRGDLIEVYKANKGFSQLAGVLNFSRSGSNLVRKPTLSQKFIDKTTSIWNITCPKLIINVLSDKLPDVVWPAECENGPQRQASDKLCGSKFYVPKPHILCIIGKI